MRRLARSRLGRNSGYAFLAHYIGKENFHGPVSVRRAGVSSVSLLFLYASKFCRSGSYVSSIVMRGGLPDHVRCLRSSTSYVLVRLRGP